MLIFADAENQLELLVELLARHDALCLRLQQVLRRRAREAGAGGGGGSGVRRDEVRRLLLRRARPVAECSRVGEAAGEDLLVPQDLVEFAHPRRDHRVLIEAIDLRQVAHALLDVNAEDLAHVVQRRRARLHERLQSAHSTHGGRDTQQPLKSLQRSSELILSSHSQSQVNEQSITSQDEHTART